MSATRTQIYLTQQQRARIDQIVDAEGLTMAEVIRRALDEYLDRIDPVPVLAGTFGAQPDAEVPNRDEWARG